MEHLPTIVIWLCQLYAAKIFLVSAYRKTTGFSRVVDEFRRWGYPFPDKVTFFLIAVWIHGGVYLLIPKLSGLAALALLPFMLVAFATLLAHGEIRRLREPAVPIALLLVVAYARAKTPIAELLVHG